MLAIDASIAAAWFLDRKNTYARFALRSALDGNAAVPGNFHSETLEALLRGLRREKLPPDAVAEAIELMAQLTLSIEFPSLSAIAMLARKHRLSAYDAGYLAVATSLRLQLATLDNDLAAAAKREHCFWTPPSRYTGSQEISFLTAPRSQRPRTGSTKRERVGP